MKGSNCEAYIIKETSMFCLHYFEPYVNFIRIRVLKNDNGDDGESREGSCSIFNYLGHITRKCKSRYLTD